MNLLGKLFIVMIFVGSIMVASFSVVIYATHTNWRAKYNEAHAAEQTTQQRLRDLETQRASMEAALTLEIRNQASRNVALFQRVNQLTQDLGAARVEVAALMAEDERRRAEVAVANAQTGLLREELEEVSARLRESQIAWVEMSTELVRKMDEAHGLSIRLTDYQTIAANLAEEFRNAMEVLRRFGLQPDPALYPTTPPAGVRGLITETRPGGWVEISIGSDSGIARGHQLDVVRHRDGRSVLVAKIEIFDHPAADRASAKVMEGFQWGIPQRGDEVMYIEISGLSPVVH